MKAKYIILSLIASLAVLTGCQKDQPHYLDEVMVSSSYVGLPLAGGSQTISVNANNAWSISEMPEWLTISPVSGSAGETTVTFTVEGTSVDREATLLLTCADATQRINVTQGVVKPTEATCKEVIAGPDSKTYIATGVCTSIANTTYGNWYLEDATGQIYIYGTVNAAGSYAWSSFGIDVGDIVTVQGPKTTYNGTVELVDVKVIKVVKSLVKIEEGETVNNAADGGKAVVKLSSKGGNVSVSVPEKAKSWLSLDSISTEKDKKGNEITVVTFAVAKNEKGPRMTEVPFSVSSGSQTSTVSATISQDGVIGTKDNPFTTEQVIEFAKEVGGDSPMNIYVEGIISKIEKNGTFSAQYGNATFWISSDGNYNNDKSKDFEAYRVLYLNNKKWVEGNDQIAVGDKVILCGKTTMYKTTAETVSGKAWIYSHNGKTK